MIISDNIPLDNEDINTLHQVFDKGKLFGIYGESGKNYIKELDPEHHPLDKIANLYQEMEKLCEKGGKKLEAKLQK